MNEVKGINKIFGKVRGREIFVWAQSPGPQENTKEKELVGPSGEFLWRELKRVGITRDIVDIQNVVRCMPADRQKHQWPPLKMRTPSKEEIKCCSVYNDEAVEQSKAKLHLVFGAIAGTSLLGKEYKKDSRTLYSDKLKAWVVCLDHPSYFIRQGYGRDSDKAPNESLKKFRSGLDEAKKILKQGNYDRYSFLKEQNYIGVTTTKVAKRAYRELKKAAYKGIRLVADMEEGKVDDKGRASEDGRSVDLCCGFTAKPGTTYTFATGHPATGMSERCRKLNRRIVKKLLTDPNIKIAFHYGVSDTDSVKRLLAVDVRGYDYDTMLAEYFRDPDAKAYGLTAIAARRYPDFLDYKSIEGPDGFTPKFLEFLETKKSYGKMSLPAKVNFARSKNGINLARLPWKKMVLYNGADCHLEKLVELSTIKYVNPVLMQVYIDASFVLQRMQRSKACQPLFDYKWSKKLIPLFDIREKKWERKLRKLAGKYAYITKDVKDKKTGKTYSKTTKKKFSPGSPEHIKWLIYEKLKYKFIGDKNEKANTKEGTLLRMALRHPKAMYVVEYRRVKKAKTTYVVGFKKCADINGGHLKTNWKTTGTATGRLSSGKDKDKKNESVINFQNIHGDPLIKCLLVSDRLWYKIYEYWVNFGDFTKKTWKKFRNVYVDLGFDFSQNELRQLAEESKDKELIKMFSSGADPHVEVGHEITGWAKETIAHDDRVRKLVKNMQFGIVFGLKGEGLYKFIKARGVKTTLEEVEKFHARYFKRFRGVKRLQEYYHAFAEKHKYVINVFGFRRRLNVDQQKEMGQEWKGSYWKNQAINTPIQGASHQLLMMSIAVLHRFPDRYPRLKNPNKEIHDALYFRLKLKYLFDGTKQGLKLMVDEPTRIVKEEFKLKKRVPLSAKPKAGFRFGVQLEGIGTDIKTEWDFLNAWCKENKKLQKDYAKQLSDLQ